MIFSGVMNGQHLVNFDFALIRVGFQNGTEFNSELLHDAIARVEGYGVGFDFSVSRNIGDDVLEIGHNFIQYDDRPKGIVGNKTKLTVSRYYVGYVFKNQISKYPFILNKGLRLVYSRHDIENTKESIDLNSSFELGALLGLDYNIDKRFLSAIGISGEYYASPFVERNKRYYNKLPIHSFAVNFNVRLRI